MLIILGNAHDCIFVYSFGGILALSVFCLLVETHADCVHMNLNGILRLILIQRIHLFVVRMNCDYLNLMMGILQC